MSYSVIVAESAASRIRQAPFGLPRVIAEHLDRLALNPSLGSSIWFGPLEGRSMYAFRVTAPPLVMNVGIVYTQDDERRCLTILDVGAIQNDPPEVVAF